MPPEPHGTSQLFAHLSQQRGVLTARLVGPSIGQREGEVIAGMIEVKLADELPVAFVVLDFTEVSFINSAGIGACVSIHTRARKGNAVVVLYAMQEGIGEVFKMTRLDKIFKIADSPKRLAKIIGA